MKTSERVRIIVICFVGTLALIGVCSLCLTLFYKNYADPSVLTAIISITGTVVGALTGTILIRSNNPPPPTNGGSSPEPSADTSPPPPGQAGGKPVGA